MPLKFWSKDYIYNVDIFCIFIQHLLANLFLCLLTNAYLIMKQYLINSRFTSNLHANIFNMHRKCLY